MAIQFYFCLFWRTSCSHGFDFFQLFKTSDDEDSKTESDSEKEEDKRAGKKTRYVVKVVNNVWENSQCFRLG